MHSEPLHSKPAHSEPAHAEAVHPEAVPSESARAARHGSEAERFEAVIGLEVHCQLATASKAFSPEPAGFVREPNVQVDFVSLGYPGTLPVLNELVVGYAVRMGLATGCSIRERSTLARKHYFYPDLPKGYQISQYEDPICYDGRMVVTNGDGSGPRPIRIKRIHMEEDAGRSIHDRGAHYTLLDFDRCGVPLLELVTEPDIRYPSEAHEFVKTIRQIVRYLGICDGNMEEGSLRCDANISVRPVGETGLRTKTEIKNVNSLRHVEQALAFEFDRQVNVYRAGGSIEQETRLWDPDRGETKVMRTKEMAHDYRYFPDPDLPPVVVNDALLELTRSQLPELPDSRRRRFVDDYELSDYDANLLTEERDVADYFEQTLHHLEHPDANEGAKGVANFVLTTVLRSDGPTGGEVGSAVVPARLGELLSMRLAGSLSSSATVELYTHLSSDDRPVQALAEELNLVQVSDVSALDPMVDAVLAEFTSQVEQYLGGKVGLIGFFIGKVMKLSAGAADPEVVRQLLLDRLDALG